MSSNGTIVAARRANLELANRVRIHRKELKQQLRCRHIGIVAVLQEPPRCCETAQIGDVLRWAPRVGRVKADRLLRDLRIPVTVRLGSMSPSRRRMVASRLVERHPAALRRELAA
jgi:hypothetical protein